MFSIGELLLLVFGEMPARRALGSLDSTAQINISGGGSTTATGGFVQIGSTRIVWATNCWPRRPVHFLSLILGRVDSLVPKRSTPSAR
jgi:hypothetical protein